MNPALLISVLQLPSKGQRQGAAQEPWWQKHDTPLARAVRHAGLCWGQPAGCSGPAQGHGSPLAPSGVQTVPSPAPGTWGTWCVLPVNA